jgi:uncharacterized membrane protein YqiK
MLPFSLPFAWLVGIAEPLGWTALTLLILALCLVLAIELLGVRYIPNNRVGIVEKLWSRQGSVSEGRIIALDDEAGFQVHLLRGGFHVKLWRWQFRIHKVPLVTVPQGQMAYVYARDGEPLPPSQTLGRVVECNNFQDARAFLGGDGEATAAARGQRGRQRAILREGLYAINQALFVIITEEKVYGLTQLGGQEFERLLGWQRELQSIEGFRAVIVGAPTYSAESDDEETPRRGRGRRVATAGIKLSCPSCNWSFSAPMNSSSGGPVVCPCPSCGTKVIGPAIPEAMPADVAKPVSTDTIAIVTIHDGPSLPPGEIIAPAVGNDRNDANYHNNYQDPEAFLRSGGCRGRQYVPLIDGTYFINRWFATVEVVPKTVVPIGYVGVVVSYYGRQGRDVSGDAFRHGERVAEGERGVWERPLGPGKYPFNTYAGDIILVPTTNFVLHWITGRTESHHYDESLKSIDLVTKDAYEPMLPLSVVVHIDYQRAPSVIQRFGDVKKLITQTLDPMLSAYFRDVAHKKTMLELLQQRDAIQGEAREELRRKFREFDIECVDVLIGKPDTAETGGKIETLLEQLRERQLSIEKIETFDRQRIAAEKQKSYMEAKAQAEMQTELTNSRVQVQIAENQGDADLARARKAAEQQVVTAQAESQQRVLVGRGESSRLLQVGLAEATVLLRKIASFGDPRLYALAQVSDYLSHSTQPLVPERVFMASSNGENGHGGGGQGMLGMLINLLVAEKAGFEPAASDELANFKELADKMTRDAMENLQQAPAVPALAEKVEVKKG